MAFYDCQASTKRKQSAGRKSNRSKDCSCHVSEYSLSLVLFRAWNFLGKYCWEGKCTSKEPAVASVYPHIQVASFEVKAFSKLKTSLSSCLLGTMHTLGLMALPFPKLFPSRAQFLLFGGSWCFLLKKSALCGASQVGPLLALHGTFHSAPKSWIHPWVPCVFYIWAPMLPGLPACTRQCGILCDNL